MTNLYNRQLIYGCMNLGGSWEEEKVTSQDIMECNQVITAALEAGINWFDHADIYKNGKSEEVFGHFLKENPDLRNKILIQSKAGIVKGQGINGSNYYNFSKKYIQEQLYRSLERLNTDYLDVFLLHRPDVLMNIEDLSSLFYQLKQDKVVRQFGVSNMSTIQIEFLEKNIGDIITNQVQLSLGHTDILDSAVEVNYSKENNSAGILEWASTYQRPIQAWGALDQGKYCGTQQCSTTNYVEKLAEKYAVSRESIVLAWLFRLPAVVQPIVGTTNINRLKSCVGADEILLTHEEWYNLWISARGKKLP